MKTLFIFLTLLCISCSNSPSEKKGGLSSHQNQNDKIIIILDSVPDSKVGLLPNDGKCILRNMCSYINDNFEEISFLYPQQFNVNDTIEINTQREGVIFNVSFFGGLSTVSFILNPNNTYHIGYNDTIPYIKDDISFNQINAYYQTLHHKVYDNKISTEKKIDHFGPMAFIKGEDRFPTQDEIDRALPSILKNVRNEIKWQENYIDSLNTSKKINTEEYAFYKSDVDLKKYIVNQNIQESRYFNLFRDEYKEDWEFQLFDDMNLDPNSYFNPKFYHLTYRYNNIDKYFNDENIYSISLLHEALAALNINPNFRKTVVSQFLDLIFSKAPWDIIKKNSEEYLSLYPETKLPEYLMAKYNIDPKNVNDVLLENGNGQMTTLNEVLKSLHGKEVVLDVWASWCAPCIKKIVEGKKEREMNKEKGVEYVFITYYDDKSDWLKKTDDLGLINEKHSYFTTNSQTNLWFKDMKINSIPCIITYDKSGIIASIEN